MRQLSFVIAALFGISLALYSVNIRIELSEARSDCEKLKEQLADANAEVEGFQTTVIPMWEKSYKEASDRAAMWLAENVELRKKVKQ